MPDRQTIDFGIKLGRHSMIAVSNGGLSTEIIKNQLDEISIEDVVYIGKTGRMLIGPRAKGQLVDMRYANDVFDHIVRDIDPNRKYRFLSSGLTKTSEELVAEILKSLKGNVQQRLDEDIKAAVVTIPASFAQRQCMATKNAAELAGFTKCPLLLEPVAASWAYGLPSNMSPKPFWLVFLFGSDTFDVSVMKAEDGDIQVVNHGGDNFLGGADIDWGIIENIIIPKIKDSFNLPEFKRGNTRWRSDFAKIKARVEEAKITLSRNQEAFLDTCTFQDADGEDVDLEGFKLTQNQVADIAEPLIERAVEKCQTLLSEKNLSTSAIEKTILVGGPTQAPYFREILADKLGIELDNSVDPLTVVSQGAAIFARTLRLD